MSQKTIQQTEIKTYIPHRHENLVIDAIQVNAEEGLGKLTLCIQENDSLGRDIFAKQKYKNKKTLIPELAMEIGALGSIISTSQIPDGFLVFFATISNFSKKKEFWLGEPIFGTVKKLGWKANFLKYTSEFFTQSGELISSGDMMASYIDMTKPNDPTAEKKTVPLPKIDCTISIQALNQVKRPDMFLCDEILHFNPETNECTSSYHYPTDHPLVRGHFPGNPVLMGIMQWMMVEDAALFLTNEWGKTGRQGTHTFICDADIIKENGVLVADAKGIIIETHYPSDSTPDSECNMYTEIIETKRLSFRDMVKPGETLFANIKNVKLL